MRLQTCSSCGKGYLSIRQNLVSAPEDCRIERGMMIWGIHEKHKDFAYTRYFCSNVFCNYEDLLTGWFN